MPVLQLDDQQFPLNSGATRIGAGADADVVIPGYSDVGIEAIIDTGGRPTIRRAEESAHVRVNGVLLGAEPTPLMHGDKVEIAGLELHYADDEKGGATKFVSASEIAALAGAKRSGAARATAASGGRLVSLVDGKEYPVADGGLLMGRDAACDVVIAQNEVSRRHAELVPGEKGYIVKDTSANGVFVNGTRIQTSHLLARADVLRIGTEEFRFYADMLAPPVQAGAPPAVQEVSIAPVLEIAPPLAAQPPADMGISLMPMMPSADMLDLELIPETPVAPPPPAAAKPPVAVAPPSSPAPQVPTPASTPARVDTRPVLATLEAMNEGPAKGTKHDLRTPLVHIGRGAHNDVRLSDESVSETHAKIQKREDGWYVVDMDSTNGTYVGGSRVSGERKIDGAPDLRFGGLKFRFLPVGPSSDIEAKGTRTIAPVGRPSAVASSQTTGRTPAATPPSTSQKPSAPKSGGVPGWVWAVVAVVVIAAVAFFVLKGKA